MADDAKTKLVNVYTSKIIRGTSTLITGTTVNIYLSYADIKQCLIQQAQVYEVIGKNNTIQLNLTNYDKDNSSGGGNSGNASNDYNIDIIKAVDDFPSSANSGILYVKRSTLEGFIWDVANQNWQLLIPHVSEEIIDGVVDTRPVTGESVKNYLTKKLNEMSGINVLGKADKIGEGHDNSIFIADNEGNIKDSGYKIGSDSFSETDEPKVATEAGVKSTLTWKVL